MNRKTFLDRILISLALLGLYGRAIAKGFEPDSNIKIMDVKRHLKFIGNTKGWSEYITDGWEIKFVVNGKEFTQIYIPHK